MHSTIRHNLLIIAALILSSVSLSAPSRSEAQSTRELAIQFRKGFVRGCNQGSTPRVTNQKGYCACMANSFQARYNGQELAALSQYVNKLGKPGTGIINLMMAPEAKICKAKYQSSSEP